MRAARPQNRKKILYLPTPRAIKKAVEILKQGGLVAFPTETVYGLGAKALDAAAVEKIFAAKGRPADNPLIVHVAEAEQIDLLVGAIPSSAEALMERFWPGPLTLVFKRSHRVPAIVSAGLETVAIRSPDHPVARALIRGLGEPIAAPSANRSGRPSPTRAEHVVEELGDVIPFILDGGPCRVGVESTVVDLVSDPPRILRPGLITSEELQEAIGEVVPFTPVEGAEASRSPGQKHRHYAPNLKMVLVPPQRLESALTRWRGSGKRFGLLCRQSGADRKGGHFYRLIRGGEEAYARGLFDALVAAEAAGVEILVVETVKKKGVGVAIMDRLERAARGSK
jgi:L-threonylcarbamoyladenylate synthase